MRTFLITLMFAASLAHAAWSDHEEARDLALDAAGLERLGIEAGAGSLTVTGVPGADRIVASARIRVPDADADKAARIIERDMVLSLERRGSRAELKSYFESRDRWLGDSPAIDLEVRVPAQLSLDVDDGSGSLEIRDIDGDLALDDGSGSVTLADIGGDVRVHDGSGVLKIAGVGGDVDIVDGSGGITLRRVTGSATIEDGSGGIHVAGVSGDVSIPKPGSGPVDIRKVQGRVFLDE